MPPSKPIEDFAGLMALLLGLFMSAEVANVISHYVTLLIAAGCGAYLSITDNDREMTAAQAVGYVLVRMLLAVLLTVPTAMWLVSIGGAWLAPNITLVPIALGIGWLKDPKSVRDWVVARLAGFLGRRVDQQQGPKDGI
ncbi:MAG: hypothetical protein JNM76_14560 [Betaproteobacteria bacterium]|nr:hypothetical protein [Betaproteobacteria bacterium]